MSEKDPMDLIETYSKEIEMDTSIDVTNIMEKQLSSPNVKHKWLFRLMKAKKHLIDLVELKDSFINTVMNKDNPLKLSKAVISNKLETQGDYKDLQKKIDHKIIATIRRQEHSYLTTQLKKVLSLSREFHIVRNSLVCH
jgi:hypothetical protein